MTNVLFIDYATLLNNDKQLVETSIFSLKEVIEEVDNLKIVCINTEEDRFSFNYDECLNKLSQALNLKKKLFFDSLDIFSYKDIVANILKWISKNKVKSFSIVINGNHSDNIAKSYANNVIFCDSFSEANAKNVIWMMSNFKNAISKNDDVFFISDTHFSHKNIIRYCNRPWNSGKDENGNLVITDDDVRRMDDEIVKRWNSIVDEDSIVWHLGDFSFGGKDNIERIFPQLNGKINLVMGNHDHYKVKYYYDLGFHRVYDKRVIINDFVILTHVPLMFLNDNCPFFQIFGHVHSSNAYYTWTKNSCCACVERHDYYPISWKTIKKKYDEMNRIETENN